MTGRRPASPPPDPPPSPGSPAPGRRPTSRPCRFVLFLGELAELLRCSEVTITRRLAEGVFPIQPRPPSIAGSAGRATESSPCWPRPRSDGRSLRGGMADAGPTAAVGGSRLPVGHRRGRGRRRIRPVRRRRPLARLHDPGRVRRQDDPGRPGPDGGRRPRGRQPMPTGARRHPPPLSFNKLAEGVVVGDVGWLAVGGRDGGIEYPVRFGVLRGSGSSAGGRRARHWAASRSKAGPPSPAFAGRSPAAPSRPRRRMATCRRA